MKYGRFPDVFVIKFDTFQIVIHRGKISIFTPFEKVKKRVQIYVILHTKKCHFSGLVPPGVWTLLEPPGFYSTLGVMNGFTISMVACYTLNNTLLGSIRVHEVRSA